MEVVPLRLLGVGRVSDNQQAVLVSFDRPLTDGELEILHREVRRAVPDIRTAHRQLWPAAAEFTG